MSSRLPSVVAPPRLEPSRVAAGVAAFGAWVAAVPSVHWALAGTAGLSPADVCVRVSTTLLSALFVYRGVRSAPRRVWTSALLGALYGVLNLAVAYSALLAVSGDPASFGLLPFAVVLGAPYGAVTGAVYGLAFGVLIRFVHPRGRARRLASPDRAFARMGMWLAAVGASVAVLSPWSGAVTAGLGLALFAAGAAREAERSLFVRRVQRGLLPEFRILSPANVPDASDLSPFVKLRPGETAHVLAWVRPGDYRVAPETLALGLVPADGVRAPSPSG